MSERSVTHPDAVTPRGTFGWVFMQTFVALAVIYVAFSLWVLLFSSHLPVGTIQRGPELLVIVPVFMTFFAGLTAVILVHIGGSGRAPSEMIRYGSEEE